MPDLVASPLGAWPSIVIAAVLLAALAVGIPRAVAAVLENIERLAEWASERVQRLVARLSSRLPIPDSDWGEFLAEHPELSGQDDP